VPLIAICPRTLDDADRDRERRVRDIAKPHLVPQGRELSRYARDRVASGAVDCCETRGTVEATPTRLEEDGE
jgi:hypothetical protein